MFIWYSLPFLVFAFLGLMWKLGLLYDSFVDYKWVIRENVFNGKRDEATLTFWAELFWVFSFFSMTVVGVFMQLLGISRPIMSLQEGLGWTFVNAAPMWGLVAAFLEKKLRLIHAKKSNYPKRPRLVSRWTGWARDEINDDWTRDAR